MQYYVHREGINRGPFTLEDLQSQVAAGSIAPADLAWHEGLAEWQPVSTFVSSAGAGPVAPPVGTIASATTGSPEEVRRAYFSHERNVRSIGTYFFFAGGLQLFLGAMLLIGGVIATMGGAGIGAHLVHVVAVAIESIIFLGLGGLTVWTAGRVKRLDRSGYVPGIIVAAIGLLGIPIGTLINGYILYLLVSEKGRFVFSDQYRAIVAATPQFQWKIALWVKILIGLVVLAFVSVVAISILLALGRPVSHVSQAPY